MLAAACGGVAAAPQVPVGSDVIVGDAMSLTGSLAQEGRLTEQGYQMWVNWADAQGGIVVGGVRPRVQLVTQDDQSKPDLSAALAANLVKSSCVQFLLGQAEKVAVGGGIDAFDSVGHAAVLSPGKFRCFRNLAVKPR